MFYCQTGTKLRAGLPKAGCSVWAPDFMEERFHNTSPGDSESTFTKAGVSETKEGLRLQGAIGEPRQCSALAP